LTLCLVDFHRVEAFLRQGWMVSLPTICHPVLDTRGVVMMKICDCEVT
jgi:hypothetical protein